MRRLSISLALLSLVAPGAFGCHTAGSDWMAQPLDGEIAAPPPPLPREQQASTEPPRRSTRTHVVSEAPPPPEPPG